MASPKKKRLLARRQGQIKVKEAGAQKSRLEAEAKAKAEQAAAEAKRKQAQLIFACTYRLGKHLMALRVSLLNASCSSWLNKNGRGAEEERKQNGRRMEEERKKNGRGRQE